MKTIISQIQSSRREFRNIKNISLAGILIAVSVVLTLFRLFITEALAVSFAFLPLATGSMLFGPVMGGVMGIVTDILGYAVRPVGAFFPGFTLSAFIMGAIYGFMLYQKPLTIGRVFVAGALNTLIVNLLLNSLWLSLLYGNAFPVLLAGRLAKNLIMLPVETALLFVILKTVLRIRNRS